MRSLVLLNFFLFTLNVFSQVQISGNLRTRIDNILNNMPETVGGNEYQNPSPENYTKWGTIITAIVNGNYANAQTNALTISYQLLEYTDTESNSLFYVLESTGSNYWGTFIFDPTPQRARLFIQIPHPKKDFNTGKQGYHVFLNTGARAFIMAGTSRCNSSTYSTCSGTTTICSGSSENYRISDQAHTEEGTFQRTTAVFESLITNMIYIQLHGFDKLEYDPYVIMGNGVSSATPPSGFQYLEALRTNLTEEDNTLTYIIAHEQPSWDRLTGSTNTQGRFINGSTLSPCTTSAGTNTGRFLHIEQEKFKLRNDQAGWTKMANAINQTFIDLLPVELMTFKAVVDNAIVILEWETATEIDNYGFEIERLKISSEQKTDGWQKIGFVSGAGNSNIPVSYTFEDSHPKSGKTWYRLKQVDTDGTFEYSKEVEVVIDYPLEFALEQNFPNPFNPTTTINYSIPKISKSYASTAEATNVVLKVFDLLGNEVATIVDAVQEPGNYSVNFDGSQLGSGVYFYTLSGEGFFNVKKLSIVK